MSFKLVFLPYQIFSVFYFTPYESGSHGTRGSCCRFRFVLFLPNTTGPFFPSKDFNFSYVHYLVLIALLSCSLLNVMS